jgi:hypothetical protein
MPEKKRTIRQLNGLPKRDGDVGIEIEIEGGHLPGQGPEGGDWVAEGDGSLRGQGMEYILRRPVMRDKVPAVLKQLKDYLAQVGAILKPSDRCGVHIHLNMQTWTLNQVMTFICLYMVVEDHLVRWCGEDRVGNLFCLRGRDAEYIIEVLVDLKKHGHFVFPRWNRAMRYSAINLVALKKFGSLEFRSMRTPDDIEDIEKWVGLLWAVREASRDFSHPAAVVEGISAAGGGEEFLDMVFGPALAAELINPDTTEMLYEGARLIQEVVYTEEVVAPRVEGDVFAQPRWDDGLLVMEEDDEEDEEDEVEVFL